MTLPWYAALWALLLVPGVAVVRRVGPALVARYDTAALRVAPPVGLGWRDADGPPREHDPAAWPALQAWCMAGAGDGRSPLWRPWAEPRVALRLSIATCAAVPGAGASRLAEAFSRHIDGSDQLDALGSGAARIGLRLRVKLHDAMWWRARQPADPWDSGYVVDEPAALQALRTFVPRRATLLVAHGLPADALRERIAILSARRAAFHHPVRLLVIGTAVPAVLGDIPVLKLPSA